MKKSIILFLIILLTGCSAVNGSDKPTPSIDASSSDVTAGTKVSEEYNRISDMSEYTLLKDENHVFISIEYFEVLDMIENKDSAIIYIGRPGCAWCQEAVVVLNDIAKEYKQPVYYVHTRSDYNVSDAGKEDFKRIEEFLYDYLLKDEDGERYMSVPDVLFMKNGEVDSNHVGTVESHNAHERVMNAEETEQLMTLYRAYFDKFMVK